MITVTKELKTSSFWLDKEVYDIDKTIIITVRIFGLKIWKKEYKQTVKPHDNWERYIAGNNKIGYIK
jgi:hypothetical protein